MKKIGLIVGLVILLVGVILFTRRESNPKIEVSPKIIPEYVSAEGKVEVMPGFEVEVGSELEGRISEFPVEEGGDIKKGDLIARIDDREFIARLKEAEAEVSLSKARLKEVESGARAEEIRRAEAVLESASVTMDYARLEVERYRELYKNNTIGKSVLDEKEEAFNIGKARVKEAEEEKRLLERGAKEETIAFHREAVKKAEATLEYVKTLLEKTSISSPISGKVIRKYLQNGEMVNKDISLVAIADINKIWINAEADETDLGRIKLRTPVEISSDAYPERVFEGWVERVSDYIGTRGIRPNDPAKNLDMKVIQVKIGLKEKGLFKPGQSVDVRIKIEEKEK
ncbi:MAG: efflux RND transporter periplasmic adaptor subunit [Nitrospirota bacterium]